MHLLYSVIYIRTVLSTYDFTISDSKMRHLSLPKHIPSGVICVTILTTISLAAVWQLETVRMPSFNDLFLRGDELASKINFSCFLIDELVLLSRILTQFDSYWRNKRRSLNFNCHFSKNVDPYFKRHKDYP